MAVGAFGLTALEDAVHVGLEGRGGPQRALGTLQAVLHRRAPSATLEMESPCLARSPVLYVVSGGRAVEADSPGGSRGLGQHRRYPPQLRGRRHRGGRGSQSDTDRKQSIQAR